MLPPGVESLTDMDTTICVCAAPRAVIETVAAPAAEAVEPAAEPEVIRKAKTDEEGDEESK